MPPSWFAFVVEPSGSPAPLSPSLPHAKKRTHPPATTVRERARLAILLAYLSGGGP
jgi:hypothetical protein